MVLVAGHPVVGSVSMASLAGARRTESAYDVADRPMDRVHQQVQAAIRPQAVALAIFGALAALALLVLVGQSLASWTGADPNCEHCAPPA